MLRIDQVSLHGAHQEDMTRGLSLDCEKSGLKIKKEGTYQKGTLNTLNFFDARGSLRPHLK